MIAGREYSGPLADIWSMGIILFALVCGYLPFEDPNTANLYKKILSGRVMFSLCALFHHIQLLRGTTEQCRLKSSRWKCMLTDSPRPFLSIFPSLSHIAFTYLLLLRVIEGDYKAPRWISGDVRNLISRILETEPSKRYTLEDIRRHAWYAAVRDADVPREESTGEEMGHSQDAHPCPVLPSPAAGPTQSPRSLLTDTQAS